MSNFIDASEGDNKNFAVTGIKTVNIHIGKSGYTSANDTETDKYFNNQVTASGRAGINVARAFNIRSDQTIQGIGLNEITYTDPVDVIINKGWTEKFDVPCIWKIVIRTTVEGQTNIKARVK